MNKISITASEKPEINFFSVEKILIPVYGIVKALKNDSK
jgi:hypothetical protein